MKIKDNSVEVDQAVQNKGTASTDYSARKFDTGFANRSEDDLESDQVEGQDEMNTEFGNGHVESEDAMSDEFGNINAQDILNEGHESEVNNEADIETNRLVDKEIAQNHVDEDGQEVEH